MQSSLFENEVTARVAERPKGQLLKWIGNKHRFAEEIVSYFPTKINRYFEPFLGSGAVLATLAPENGVASDNFAPLVEIWTTLRLNPDTLIEWYASRWERFNKGGKLTQYESIKADYNARPNGADLLFLCRSCYGGVVRFRKTDGFMSTPVGIHDPIRPESFAARAREWHRRTLHTEVEHSGYEEVMLRARHGDLIYCDPPYSHSQSILYGAQSFSLERLFEVIGACKRLGVCVALSIDGTKKSGDVDCRLPIPHGLFEREVFIQCGRSMLRRFLMEGQTLHEEHVSDRLLLTY